MPNYGDVVLNLPPDWSRSRIAGDPSFVLTTVGHENGVPDAYLTDKPDQEHQFRWCATDDQSGTSTLRTQHYAFCTRKNWTKNPNLWEWDGEGFILHNGQRLMAREKEWFIKDREEKELAEQARERRRGVTQEEEQSMRRLESQGAIIEDERGRPLKPLSKTEQQKKNW
jgi:hypothetical protein